MLPEPTPPESASWEARNDQLRLEEWNVGMALLAASRRRLRFVLSGLAPRSALAEAARFADLGSRLARRAITRAETAEIVSSATHDRFLSEYEDAIQAIVASGTAANAADVKPAPLSLPSTNNN